MLHQVELRGADDRGTALDRLCRLARAYVLELGRDDRFTVHARLQNDLVRQVDWTPADGSRALGSMLEDYAEYFEGIEFPPLDADCAPAVAHQDRIYLHGVGLNVVDVRGSEWTATRMESLAAQDGELPANPLDASERQRRIALYRCTWRGAGAHSPTEIVQQLQHGLLDADATVRSVAAALVGRCRALQLVEPLRTLLGDTDARVRAHAVLGLQRVDNVAAIAATAPLLHDGDAAVRQAAFGVLRHVQHLPWARRKVLMAEIAIDLFAALPFLDTEQNTSLLEWFVGSQGVPALKVVQALTRQEETSVASKAVAVLASLENVDVLPALVELLDTGSEEVRTAVVQAVQSETHRAALLQRPALKQQVLAILRRITEEG